MCWSLINYSECWTILRALLLKKTSPVKTLCSWSSPAHSWCSSWTAGIEKFNSAWHMEDDFGVVKCCSVWCDHRLNKNAQNVTFSFLAVKKKVVKHNIFTNYPVYCPASRPQTVTKRRKTWVLLKPTWSQLIPHVLIGKCQAEYLSGMCCLHRLCRVSYSE